MTQLSVNLNKVALLRNARNLGIPSVIKTAQICIEAGAYGITVHPRPDERHIRYSDVYELKDMLTVEFNIEGNPFTGKYMEIVSDIKPDQATLVPDEPGQNTSDHGWDIDKNKDRLSPVIEKLKGLGIRVSLFVDPDAATVEKAKELGTDRVELYTEPYARAFSENKNLSEMINRYAVAARAALKIGLGLNAGHDLNLCNLTKFLNDVPEISEVSIGHALIADAIEMGLYNSVKEYCGILKSV
ncbi:MAG: pyridoxine 5'-phosphate synthase [Planctomycetes bacterium]|nr:pyridoxine 5'-phosphate synthase [Planctomycetota bacterium]